MSLEIQKNFYRIRYRTRRLPQGEVEKRVPVFEVEDVSCIFSMLGGIETAWVGTRMVHGREDLPPTSLL
jgi:hypothetical protein